MFTMTLTQTCMARAAVDPAAINSPVKSGALIAIITYIFCNYIVAHVIALRQYKLDVFNNILTLYRFI